MGYSSDVTNKEWEIIERLLPQKKKTRPLEWTKRQILNGILYQLKNGCNWADLPKDLPPYSTVFWHYKQWREEDVLERIMTELHGRVREQVKKKPQWTTLIVIDSQAVKNTCNASIDSKGFCFYKTTNGIKRHLAVDILGFPAWCIFMVGKPDRKCIRFFTHCTKANVSDDQGLIEMLTDNIDYFKSKPLELPKITILMDHGYHPDKLTTALEQVYPQIMTKIQFELSAKPSKAEEVPFLVRCIISGESG